MGSNEMDGRAGHCVVDSGEAPDKTRREWLTALVGGIAATSLLACESGTVEDEQLGELQEHLGSDINTVSSLRSLAAPASGNPSRLLLGTTTPGDGGGGLFVWKVLSTTVVDNGVTIIKPDSYSGMGRWVRLATCSSIAELRAMPSPSSGTARWNVLGYYAPSDGGGGTFVWDAAASAPDNGGTVIKPLSNPTFGRWRRVTEGQPINVRWFGAKGDGLSDDAPIFRAALAAAAANTAAPPIPVFVPAGRFRMQSAVPTGAAAETACVILSTGMKLFGQGETSILYWPGGGPLPYPRSNPTNDPMPNDVIVVDGSDVTISDLMFLGDNGTADGTGYCVSENYDHAAINGWYWNGHVRLRQNLIIERCRFQNLYGFAAHDAPGWFARTKFANNVLYYCGNGENLNGNDSLHIDNIFVSSEGIETSGARVQIRGNHISGKTAVISVTGDTWGNGQMPTLQVTVADNVLDLSEAQFGLIGIIANEAVNVTISGNTVKNAPDHAIAIVACKGITITGNTVYWDDVGSVSSNGAIYVANTIDAVVSSNAITANSAIAFGILALNAERLGIHGNTVRGTMNTGIYVREKADISITSNLVFEGTRGVQLQIVAGAQLVGNRLLDNSVDDLAFDAACTDIRLSLNRYDVNNTSIQGQVTYDEGNG